MNQDDFETLQKAYTLRGITLHQLNERIVSLEEENARLKELLRLQQDKLFGKKSEAKNSLHSSPLTTHLVQPTTQPPELKTTVVASHVRHIPPRGKRVSHQ